jgi:hypothetical protein
VDEKPTEVQQVFVGRLGAPTTTTGIRTIKQGRTLVAKGRDTLLKNLAEYPKKPILILEYSKKIRFILKKKKKKKNNTMVTL